MEWDFETEDIEALCEFMGSPCTQRMTRIQPLPIDQHNSPFKGQVVLITGGGTGLGRAYARAFAKHGAKVAVTSRNLANLNETSRKIRRNGGQAFAVTADMTKPKSIYDMVKKVTKKFGPIDLLINNHGTGGEVEAWWKLVNQNRYQETLKVNYGGAFWSTGVVCQQMHDLGRSGRIINIASSTVESRPEYLGIYAYSKHLVVEMTEAVAEGLGKGGVKIFAVHPGTVDTAMTEAMLNSPNAAKLTLLHQIFDTHQDVSEEVATELIMHVASGEVDHLSGQFLCRKESTVTQLQE